jgi:arginase family enzyme
MVEPRQEPKPTPEGILTFLGASLGDVEDLKEGMIAVVGVSFDLSTTGRVGARWTPVKVRETSGYYGRYLEGTVEITTGEVLETADKSKLLDLSDMNVYPLEWPKTEAALRRQMTDIASRGPIILVLGGDHFITYPLVQGYRDAIVARGGKKVGYIQFSGGLDLGYSRGPIILVLGGDHFITYPLVQGYRDAIVARGGKKVGYIQFSGGLDLGYSDPLWGKVWRGATARRILETGTVDPGNMVWIGVKGYQPQKELAFAQEMGLRVFSLEDIRRDGIRRVMEEALKIAGDGCDSIYASVDYDVVDGGNAPGAAGTNFRGMSNVELLLAVDMLAQGNVGAMDIVGANPLLELLSETAERFGAWLAFRFIWPHIRKEGLKSLPLDSTLRERPRPAQVEPDS